MSDKSSYITASDESINVYGYRILTEGIDLSWMIEHNPVMLLNHNPNVILGKWAELKKESGKVLSSPEFDLDDKEAVKYSRKYDKGMLNCASIHIDVLELSEDVALKLPGQRNATITKSVAREISLTPIPGNRNAVRLTYQGKTFDLSNEQQRLALSTTIEQSLNNNTNQKSMDFKQQVAKTLGLSADAADSVLIEAVQQAKTSADEVDDLKTKMQALHDARANDLVAGIEDETAKASVLKLAATDFDLAKNLADQLKEKGEGNETTPPRTTITQQLAAQQTAQSTGAEVKDWDWYQKNDVAKLELMEAAPAGSDDRNEFERLFKQEYGVNPQ